MTVYATAAELRDRIEKTSNATDVVLLEILTAASQAIDLLCNRPDGFVALSIATARLYAGLGRAYIIVDEFTAATLLAVKESPDDTAYTFWAAADWIAFAGGPENPDFNSSPKNGIMVASGGDYASFLSGMYEKSHRVPTVQITAKWGYAATCPPVIKSATIAQAARWWKRYQTAWADAVGTGDFGILLYRKALDPDIQAMVVATRLIRPVY
jgi:hypothetical protein